MFLAPRLESLLLLTLELAPIDLAIALGFLFVNSIPGLLTVARIAISYIKA